MSQAASYLWTCISLDGRVVSASGAAVFEQEPHALVGATLASLVAADDAAAVTDMLARAAADDAPVAVRCRIGARILELCGHRVQQGDATTIHVLTRDITAEEARAAHDEQQMQRQATLLANVPGAVWATWDIDTPHPSSYISEYVYTLTGYTPDEWNARPNAYLETAHPDDRARLIAETPRIFARGHDISQFRWIHRDGRIVWVEVHLVVVRDAAGVPTGLCGVTMDITQQKEAEAARTRLHEEIIHTQERILAELSTPLIPLGDRTVVMPLIGLLDGARAERVTEALLHGVATSRARVAIVDITGVPSLDTRSADALIRAARGVRLLGAEVVLTGIRPEVAQALVGLGTDLQGIVTRNTLDAGIRYASERG